MSVSIMQNAGVRYQVVGGEEGLAIFSSSESLFVRVAGELGWAS